MMVNLRNVVLSCAVALSAACGPAEELPELAQRQQEIRGGKVNNGDPNVFMLAMDYPNGGGFLCTSTLIGRRTLLTAAHCVDVYGGQFPSTIRATNLTDAPDWDATEGWLTSSDMVIHENWNPQVLASTADLAMVQLTVAPPIKRKPWSQASLNAKVGAELRAVGYGITYQGGGDSGIKREATMTIRSIDSNNLNTGDRNNFGICSGDSGGPSFHTFEDGVERQIGIHSYGGSEGGCADGTDVRTDFYRAWISARLAELDASCDADNVCKEGCTPADTDCLCVGNGSCDPACADPSQDPDCAEACVANGVCATGCATADPDCSEPFKGCDQADDCASRICVGDAQYPGTYCSQACTGSGECPDGYECAESVCKRVQLPVVQPGEDCTEGQTFCAEDTVCTGPAGQQTTCQKRCYSILACTGACEAGQNGFSYCTPLIGEEVPVDPEPEGGCGCASATTFAPVGLFALVLLGLRRRRVA